MSTQKKGLSPLAWVAIGCGGLALIVLIVGGIAVAWGLKKGADFLEEAEANPEIAAAKLIALAPEIDLVATDEANRTVTFKNNQTGEEVEVNFEDISEGRVSFSSGEGLTVLEASPNEDGSGGMTVTTNDGQAYFGEGLGDQELPEWFELYEGTKVEGSMISNSNGLFGGTVTVVPPAGKADDFYAFYKKSMEDLGLEINESTLAMDGDKTLILTGKKADDSLNWSLTYSIKTSGDAAVFQFFQQN